MINPTLSDGLVKGVRPLLVVCPIHFLVGELHETPKRWWVIHDGRRCMLAPKSVLPRELLELFEVATE